MSSLLERIKAGNRAVKIVKFPGTDHDVGLRVLSNAELQDALFATEARFKAKGIEASVSTVEAYEDENTTQILFRALRDPEDPVRPFAASVDEFRKNITREEKNILVEMYNDHEKDVSPSERTLSEEELEAIFEDLKKKPELGSSLSTSALRRLVVFLASRPSS